jgi:hypothetical protein
MSKTKSKQSNLDAPVFHELKFHPGHYAKVYWPIRKAFGASIDKVVCITNSSIFTRPNGTKIEVVSLFEGRSFPMINYKIEGDENIHATSMHWFAYNIANEEVQEDISLTNDKIDLVL